MGKIISVVSNKGGTGKTSLVSNYATILAEKNPKKKVLMIDTDSQGNLSMSFGYDPNEFDKTVIDVFLGRSKFKDIVKPTELKNLFICPSNEEMEGLEFEVLTNLENYKYPFELLRTAIEEVKNKYDYVLFDTPPSLGLTVGNVLNVTDSIMIPVTSDLFSQRGLKRIKNTVDGFNKNRTQPIEIIGVLRTQANKQTNVFTISSQEVMKFCREHGIRCFETVIGQSVRFSDSVMLQGKPAVLTNKKHPTVINYYELWEEINNG